MGVDLARLRGWWMVASRARNGAAACRRNWWASAAGVGMEAGMSVGEVLCGLMGCTLTPGRDGAFLEPSQNRTPVLICVREQAT